MAKSKIRPHPLQVAKQEVRLPSGAFLRALPFTVDRATRLRLDAIVFAADVLASAYVQMVEVAVAAGTSDSTEDASTRLFQCAWTIVDQVHNIRLLLDKLERKIPEAEQFRTDFAVARELRNRMDHLNAHIPNIANSAKPGDSLFGSISYVLEVEHGSGDDRQKFFVLRQTGAVQPGQKMAELRVPSELRLPVGNFQLGAIGRTLDIDQAVTDLGLVMTALNEEIEQVIMAQIKSKAAELSRPEADLLAHYGANITIALAFNAAVEKLETD